MSVWVVAKVYNNHAEAFAFSTEQKARDWVHVQRGRADGILDLETQIDTFSYEYKINELKIDAEELPIGFFEEEYIRRGRSLDSRDYNKIERTFNRHGYDREYLPIASIWKADKPPEPERKQVFMSGWHQDLTATLLNKIKGLPMAVTGIIAGYAIRAPLMFKPRCNIRTCFEVDCTSTMTKCYIGERERCGNTYCDTIVPATSWDEEKMSRTYCKPCTTKIIAQQCLGTDCRTPAVKGKQYCVLCGMRKYSLRPSTKHMEYYDSSDHDPWNVPNEVRATDLVCVYVGAWNRFVRLFREIRYNLLLAQFNNKEQLYVVGVLDGFTVYPVEADEIGVIAKLKLSIPHPVELWDGALLVDTPYVFDNMLIQTNGDTIPKYTGCGPPSNEPIKPKPEPLSSGVESKGEQGPATSVETKRGPTLGVESKSERGPATSVESKSEHGPATSVESKSEHGPTISVSRLPPLGTTSISSSTYLAALGTGQLPSGLTFDAAELQRYWREQRL
jgi:hypothetical protein